MGGGEVCWVLPPCFAITPWPVCRHQKDRTMEVHQNGSIWSTKPNAASQNGNLMNLIYYSLPRTARMGLANMSSSAWVVDYIELGESQIIRPVMVKTLVNCQPWNCVCK